MLKTVSAALSLAALSGAAPALAMKPPSPPRAPAPRGALRLAVGFRAHPHLNAAVTEGLTRRGVQSLAAAALVPGSVYPLLVEGELEDLREATGQVSCSVRYSLGPDSTRGALDSYTLAASVALPARAGGDRASLVERAEEFCVKALGEKLAATVAGAATPANE